MRRAQTARFRLLIGAFALTVGLLGGAAAQAGQADDLRTDASGLSARNADLSALENGALLELYAAETRLGRAERRLASLEARADELARDEANARARLELARRAESTAQAQLGDRLIALYVEGEPDALEILLGASSLDEVIGALDGFERLAAEDERIVAQVEQAQTDLKAAVNSLEREQATLHDTLGAATEVRGGLAADRDRLAAYVESLRTEQALNDREIGELTARAQAAEERSAGLETATATAVFAPISSADPPAAAVAEAAPGQPGRTLTVDAVAYSLPGYTASGLPVGKGVVAVDPTVIPLGTRMYVPGYGPAVAADVGTAIKGNIIDLWFPTYEQAAAWGRKTVTITIYG